MWFLKAASALVCTAHSLKHNTQHDDALFSPNLKCRIAFLLLWDNTKCMNHIKRSNSEGDHIGLLLLGTDYWVVLSWRWIDRVRVEWAFFRLSWPFKHPKVPFLTHFRHGQNTITEAHISTLISFVEQIVFFNFLLTPPSLSLFFSLSLVLCMS